MSARQSGLEFDDALIQLIRTRYMNNPMMTEIQQMEAMNTLVDRFVRNRDLIDKKGWLLETMPRMYEIENPDLFDSVKSKL